MKALVTILIISYYTLPNINSPIIVKNTEDTIYVFKLKPHQCNWKSCGLKGQFILHDKYRRDTDEYWFDKTHFLHPDWTKEQVEEELEEKQSFSNI